MYCLALSIVWSNLAFRVEALLTLSMSNFLTLGVKKEEEVLWVIFDVSLSKDEC